MKTTPRLPQSLLGTALIALLPPVLQASTITDNFTDASAWGKALTDAGGNLKVEGGRMNYTSDSTAESFAAILRKAPLLPTNTDWSMKVDVHLNPFPLKKEGQFSDVFLGFGKTSNWIDTHVTFEFGRGLWGSHNGFYIQDDVRINGAETPDLFSAWNLSSPDVSLRMDYSASNHSITYYFDGDGATGGYDWVAQGTANLASGTYNLKMGAKDTFTLLLVGSSEFQTVATGQAWFDNLRVTVGGIGDNPEIVVQQPAGSGLADGIAKKSFGTVTVGNSSPTKSFTIKNTGSGSLKNLAITKNGANASDFIVTAPAKTTLAPGTSTTFKVTFKPGASGTRSAAIHVKSNDANENPFDIKLAGQGAK